CHCAGAPACPSTCQAVYVVAGSGAPLTSTAGLVSGLVGALNAPAIAPTSCGMPGATCPVDLLTGNLVLQLTPPAAVPIEILPVLTYGSGAPAAGEFGYGWTGTFSRKVTAVSGTAANVATGEGVVYAYTNLDPFEGKYTPPVDAANALFQNFDAGS